MDCKISIKNEGSKLENATQSSAEKKDAIKVKLEDSAPSGTENVTVKENSNGLLTLKVDAAALHPVVQELYKAKRVVIVTGAGISVNGGIPDFRSADGLYKLVKSKYPHYSIKSTSGKDLFDGNLFREAGTRKLFYIFMAELRDMVARAQMTKCHEFIAKLSSWNKLLRCYTQNIDNLEHRLGLNCDLDHKKNKVVQLHGNLNSLVCTLCKYEIDSWSEEHVTVFKTGTAPSCPKCQEVQEKRSLSGMRERSVGLLRPNIVLYNEFHAKGDAIAETIRKDAGRRPDFLIVMGTSLKIPGLKQLIKQMAFEVKAPRKSRRETSGGLQARPLSSSRKSNSDNTIASETLRPNVIFINKTPCGKEWHNLFDCQILGDADEAVALVQSGVDVLVSEHEERLAARRRKKEAKLEADKAQPKIDGYFKSQKIRTAIVTGAKSETQSVRQASITQKV